jgi:hypothetical protein
LKKKGGLSFRAAFFNCISRNWLLAFFAAYPAMPYPWCNPGKIVTLTEKVNLEKDLRSRHFIDRFRIRGWIRAKFHQR